MTTYDAYRALHVWQELKEEQSNMENFWHTYACVWHTWYMKNRWA